MSSRDKPPVDSRPPMLSVSALVRSARDALEHRFGLLWVTGEISNFTRAASGHCYFTLKDDDAQVDCVMFRGRATGLDWQARDGDRVEARVLVTLYEPRGRFQLNVEAMRRAGLGALYERFLKLRDRLQREGLFDDGLKREVPAYPRVAGVITSLAAAALRDVLTTLARRNPALQVIVYPTPVQGEGAAPRIAAAIATASARAECDVLLLVRGGGSIEDLWSFNEEVVARALRASRIPVVVGVGHETDVTIADFAADRRAPTPTAAAELVSPSRAELLARVRDLVRHSARETRRRLETATQTLDALGRRLVHPAARLRASRQLTAQLAARLALALARATDLAQARLREAPRRLARATAQRLALDLARLERSRAALGSLDPQAVLARGYSITRDAGGALVRDASRLAPGERIQTTLARGWIESEVKSTRRS